MDSQQWENYSQAFGFLGNSLLNPPTQTEPVALNVDFWAGFEVFENPQVSQAAQVCAQAANQVVSGCEGSVDAAAHRVAVEYTALFVGPRKPLVLPWESGHRVAGNEVGFGQATFEIRTLLRELGLEVSNSNNQYEDHMGIELLYLCEACSRRSTGQDVPADQDLKDYVAKHPLSWAEAFASKVAGERPQGFYAALTSLIVALLHDFQSQL